MKKLNLLFTALLLLCCVGTAKAVEVTIDGIKYNVIAKGKQATVISGDTKYSGDIVIPSEIIYNNVTCNVTSIGDEAFRDCTKLTSITIPNSVTSIEYMAFNGCSGLTSITIPNSVTSIGNSAFEGCTGLTSITIPNSVTSIGNYAFSWCTSLASIEIPNSVTSIGSEAFNWCNGLTSITIPNSVTSIGSCAFYNCSGLKEVHINDIAAWCNIDFEDCVANPMCYAHNLYLNNELITELVIPDGVTSIGKEAFYDCEGLTSITIPNSVTSIGKSAFYGCSRLKEVHINDLVAWCSIDFGSSSANPLYYAQNLYLNNELITELVIPNGVTSIGYAAFYSCSGLTSVTIPNSVTSIGIGAFESCTGLKTVINLSNLTFSKGSNSNGYIACYADNVYNAPNGSIEDDYIFGKPNDISTLILYLGNETELTLPADYKGESYVIGASAFNGNNTITSITIPNSVTRIGNDAFSNCENLTDVYCLATNVPYTYINPFLGSYPEYMTLHVPAEAINSYKTTKPWSSFGNIVTLDGEIVEPEEPEVKICATPTISYNNGKLSFECETEGAEFTTDVTCSDINKFYDSEINFSATYNISVYATAAGYENSDIVNATLCWIECDCDADDNTDIINIPAKAVFVTSNNGTINISCSLEGEVVELYTSDAMFIGSTAIENGCATIESGLSKGNIAIVKIGEKSIKVIID